MGPPHPEPVTNRRTNRNTHSRPSIQCFDRSRTTTDHAQALSCIPAEGGPEGGYEIAMFQVPDVSICNRVCPAQLGKGT